MNDLEEWNREKQDDISRCERYKAIYEARDNPEDVIDEQTGNVEIDVKQMFSHSYMPIGAAVVDSFVCQLYNNFFGTPDYLLMTSNDFAKQAACYKISAHMIKQHKEMKFRHTIYKALLQAACFDYSITGARWMMQPGFVNKRKTEKTFKQYGPISLPFKQIKMEQEWRPNKIDRPDIFHISYFNCCHDTLAIDGFNDSRGFIDWREDMIETLIAMAKTDQTPWGKYKNIDKVLKIWQTENAKFIKEMESKAESEEQLLEWYESRKIPVIRYWSRDHIIETAYGEVISRINVSDWPLQRWGIFEMPDPKFKMMGVLQRIERNQWDINESLNNRRDWENLVTDPIALVHDDILPADGDQTLHHGKVFTGDWSGAASDKIWIHSPGTNPSGSMAEEMMFQFSAIEKVSISENQQGSYVSRGTRRTATETAQVGQAADNKTTRISLDLEDCCLIPIYMNQFLLNQSFMSESERFKHFGKYGDRFIMINPEDYYLDSMPDFYPMGTLELSQSPIRLQQFMLAMDRAMLMPELHNWENIYAYLWSELVPKFHDSFVKDPRMLSTDIPPEVENKLFAIGQVPEVMPKNIDKDHIRTHRALQKTPDYLTWPKAFQMNVEQHIEAHEQKQSMTINMVNFGNQQMQGSQDQSDPNRGIRPPAMR
jgi:hypothetical protein